MKDLVGLKKHDDENLKKSKKSVSLRKKRTKIGKKLTPKTRRYYFLKAFFRVALLNFFLVTISIILCFTTSFRLENIVYDNNSFYDNSKISEELKQFQNRSILLCNLNKIYNIIYEKFPEIDSIKIRKSLPHTLILTLNNAEYLYCLPHDGEYFVVSSKKKIVKKTNLPPENLLIVNNIDLDCYEICHIAELNDKNKEKILFEILDFTKKYEIPDLTLIDFENTGNIVIKLNNSLKIELGSSSNLNEKFSNLKQILTYKINPTTHGVLDLSGERGGNLIYFRETE